MGLDDCEQLASLETGPYNWIIITHVKGEFGFCKMSAFPYSWSILKLFRRKLTVTIMRRIAFRIANFCVRMKLN